PALSKSPLYRRSTPPSTSRSNNLRAARLNWPLVHISVGLFPLGTASMDRQRWRNTEGFSTRCASLLGALKFGICLTASSGMVHGSHDSRAAASTVQSPTSPATVTPDEISSTQRFAAVKSTSRFSAESGQEIAIS